MIPKELFNQTLTDTVALDERFGISIPGVEGAKNIYYEDLLAQIQLDSPKFTYGSSLPIEHLDKDLFYNTTDKTLYYWNGSNWVSAYEYLVTLNTTQTITGRKTMSNLLQIFDGYALYICSEEAADTIGDIRISNQMEGRIVVEACITGNATKGSGVWEEVLPSKLTENYVWVGDSNNRPAEFIISDVILGIGTLVAGVCTVTDSRITTNSIVLCSPSTTGTLTGNLYYAANSGNVQFSGANTDTVQFSYEIYL